MMPAIYGYIVEWCYPATFAWTLSASVGYLVDYFNVLICLSSHYVLVRDFKIYGFFLN